MSNKLRFEIITNDNLDMAIKIHNTIFPNEKEDGTRNYIESINRDSYREELEHYIIFCGNEPIGVRGIYSYHGYPNDVWLGWFGVLPNKRNKGYGSKIFRDTVDITKKKGYKALRVYTEEDNKEAIKFYYKEGMIREKYQNKNEDPKYVKNVIIFSKSLTEEPIKKWNNKFLELTDQYKKERKEG